MALLEVHHVSKAFGGVKALQDVSLAVDEGRVKAVIGPNGAGKTTLFNAISGATPPDRGTIRFAGHSVAGAEPYRIARLGVARTFQNLSLFDNLTVLENVLVGRHTRTHAGVLSTALRLPWQRREEAQATEVAMGHLASVGLFRRVHDSVAALSFGQRRLVELARALAMEPRLLLLDEPASGLNPRETDDLATLIRRIRDSGVTVLLVEHDMSLVMDVADEILVLHYGQRIAEGTPADVRNNPDVVAIYLGGGLAGAAR